MSEVGESFDNIQRISFKRKKQTSINVNCPLNDTITRIRNGYRRTDLNYIYVINSKFIKSILEKLHELGYIGEIETQDREIKVNLIRNKNKNYNEFFIKSYSSPGRRLYCSYNKIPRRMFGVRGHTLLSTNLGIITEQVAIEKKVGGLLLLEVYWCQR